MTREKENFIKWVRVHKRELVIAGVCITAVISVILGYKNKAELMKLWKSLEGKICKQSQTKTIINDSKKVDVISSVEPFSVAIAEYASNIIANPQTVTAHKRNLPEGWKASPNKMSTALENGFNLQGNQTWVKEYNRNRIAA